MIGTVGVLGMAMAASAFGSDLSAGYLNSKSREASVSFQDNAQRIQITTTAMKFYWGRAEQGSGKLFVVDSRGNIQTPRGTFRDAIGHSVALPTSSDDKVVVLNRYGNIAWAIGLDDVEILALAPRDAQNVARLVIEAQKRPLFGALRYSSSVLSNMKSDADTIAAMFLSSVRMMGGSDVEQLTRKLMEKNAAGHLKGVSLVSQGGDGSGGTGKVAQGGDGSGGTGLVNPIAQGGDGSGGTGLVNPIAQGGDGSGGTGYSADVAIKLGSITGMNTLPAIKGLSAVAKGKVVIIQ